MGKSMTDPFAPPLALCINKHQSLCYDILRTTRQTMFNKLETTFLATSLGILWSIRVSTCVQNYLYDSVCHGAFSKDTNNPQRITVYNILQVHGKIWSKEYGNTILRHWWLNGCTWSNHIIYRRKTNLRIHQTRMAGERLVLSTSMTETLLEK